MAELGLTDTVGILRPPGVRPRCNSAGLGWEQLCASSREEHSCQAEFDPAPTHLLILRLGGPVTVRRGPGRGSQARKIPAGRLFLQSAGRALEVELAGRLDTVHAYLTDEVLREADDGRPVELSEELGCTDPLAEQLLLTPASLVRGRQSSDRTYVDHLTQMLAAQLVQRRSRRATEPPRVHCGLSDRQLAAVRELMEKRLVEPLPVADLAAAASLSCKPVHPPVPGEHGPVTTPVPARAAPGPRLPTAAPGERLDPGGGGPLRLLPPGASDQGDAYAAGHHTGRRAPRRVSVFLFPLCTAESPHRPTPPQGTDRTGDLLVVPWLLGRHGCGCFPDRGGRPCRRSASE